MPKTSLPTTRSAPSYAWAWACFARRGCGSGRSGPLLVGHPAGDSGDEERHPPFGVVPKPGRRLSVERSGPVLPPFATDPAMSPHDAMEFAKLAILGLVM